MAKFGLIYAGAQKNIGPPGLVVVIVREDLLGARAPGHAAVWDYKAMADEDSMLNTPPTFAWYLAGLVFKWLQEQGGLAAIAASATQPRRERSTRRSTAPGFYRNPVDKDCRSWMNVPFTLAEPELDTLFLARGAARRVSSNLEGHRSVGGMRASIYNAMPPEGVDALVAFMKDFERRHG